MGLTLARALRLLADDPSQAHPHSFPVTAFVGAGGKTTAMFQLARELPPPVIVTASTHLAVEQAALADRHLKARTLRDLHALMPEGVTLVTGPSAADGRTEAVRQEVLVSLHDLARRSGTPLLIEADGSRQRPLKAPADHEPAIPEFADVVVVVAGVDAVGKPLTDDWVHRPERFAEVSGLRHGEPITVTALGRVLSSPSSGLKGMPRHARTAALLNRADTPALQALGGGMASSLLEAFGSVIVASLREGAVYAVHERVAGVILAAGESSRFGRPKQLLAWRDGTFVRAVAKTAISGGLSPVIVVTGAEAEAVEAALSDLPVTIARNAAWRNGQASSVRVGLAACPASAGAAIFMLADQPQVPHAILAALVETHAASLSPIVAPLVQGNRRGNPVLFDRDAFEALRGLQGDEGGRVLFTKYPVEYLPWNDERLLMDVDTEADYQRLKEMYER